MYENCDAKHRSGWLPKGLEVRVATKNDVMGIAKISAEKNKTDIESSIQRVSKEFENSGQRF